MGLHQLSSDRQDYDVPPSNRGTIDGVSPSSRRPSYDALRNFTGPRKASLGDDLYDTPPSSKRGSVENTSCLYDTPPSSKRASSERTPPHSNRSSASRDSGANLLSSYSPSQLSLASHQSGSVLSLPTVVRQRSDSHSSSETSRSSRSSLDRILSEEGPPIYETLSPAASTEHLAPGDPIYDTPPSRNHVLSQANPTSKTSLASAASNESLLSNNSSFSSVHMSQGTSLSDSARSSMDLPADIYDVPPSALEIDRSRKQLSMDSGLGFYDSPVRSRPSSSSSNTVILEGMKSSQSSFDCKPTPATKEITRSRSLENTIDDVYDTPRNNMPKVGLKKPGALSGSGSSSSFSEPSSVYDIPPQVTRDSVISERSDSSDDNQRLSSSSLDIEQQMAELLLYDELLLDFDSASELLVKRQQDVYKATNRLASFVNNTWRSRSSLEKTLYDIKLSCTLVRNSLHDFIDFSHGAIANAVRLPDRYLANKLLKYVAPLHSTFDLVNKSFINLEEIKWQVSLLSEPLDKTRPDDLGQIALVAKDLMLEVKKVASFIQSNGAVLFRRAPVGDNKKPLMSSKPPIVPKAGENSGGKATGVGNGKPKNIQHRPLPSVPSIDKGLTLAALSEKHKLSLYDIKAVLHKDDYAECDELPPEKDPQQAQLTEQCMQEYDYVQLDSRDIYTTCHSKNLQPVDDAKSSQDEKDVSSNTFKDMNPKGSSPERNTQLIDNDLELVPVKDVQPESNKDIAEAKVENVVDRNSMENSRFSFENKADTTAEDASEFDLPEQDMKTPVNISSASSSESEFIIPSPEPEKGNMARDILDPNDRQVLVYYSEQINAHSTLLANAIDAFIGVVASKEPPNVFISHSKFVIVSAHKLVHIGDTIHRNLISNSMSVRIMQCANHLCDCLKASVMATKTAALQYPSPPAVQEMVDRVIAVSHAAHDLKLTIGQAAKH